MKKKYNSPLFDLIYVNIKEDILVFSGLPEEFGGEVKEDIILDQFK